MATFVRDRYGIPDNLPNWPIEDRNEGQNPSNGNDKVRRGLLPSANVMQERIDHRRELLISAIGWLGTDFGQL